MKRVVLVSALIAGVAFAQDWRSGVTAEERSKIDAATPGKAPAKPKKPRKLLVMNLDMKAGKKVKIHHPSVPLGDYLLEQIGKKTGAWEIVVSDDVAMWRIEKLKAFDAIVFMNTTGVLTEDKDLRWSLLRYVRDGGGFAAFHAGGPATFVEYPKYDQFPEFGVMVGGYENGGHPWSHREPHTVRVEEPKHPVTKMFGAGPIEVTDEVFQMQAPYSREAIRVLLSIDTEKSGMEKRRVLPERREDRDFATSWIKRYGQGRVFYTYLGHNKETWWNPKYAQHFLAGIQYAIGDLKADDTPSRFAKKK